MSLDNFNVQTKLGQPWKRPPFIQTKLLRWTIIFGIIAYLIAAYYDSRCELVPRL